MAMKRFLLSFTAVILFLLMAVAFRLPADVDAEAVKGAWELTGSNEQQVLLFADGYFTHTSYNKNDRRFVQTRGGTYTVEGDKLKVTYEFDTKEKDGIGQTKTYTMSLQSNRMTADLTGRQEAWTRLDDGTAGLAGSWRITGRQQDGKLVQIHQTGTRKTVKILSGTRFQWAAIDPGTKQFMGTGGGTYTFENGKYTEHIEFFSRDSSRVGSSLSFDGRLENGDWHHSGLSSRGDPIYEVWSRKE
jgi:hypothetical protein